MRVFLMYRRNREAVVAMHQTDDASVPGDEPTLEGAVFSDGKVVVRWLTPNRSTVVWDSFEDFEAVHVSNHPDYGTEIVWLYGSPADDPPLESSRVPTKRLAFDETEALTDVKHYRQSGGPVE